MPRKGRKELVVILVVTAATVVLLDQFTKYLIRTAFSIGESVPVINGYLHITYTTNTGAAFGLFPKAASFFLLAKIIVIALMIIAQIAIPHKTLLWRLSGGFIIGGALGNLIDRMTLGFITDFIDVGIWPVFNLADSAVVVGVLLLAYELLRNPVEWQANREPS